MESPASPGPTPSLLEQVFAAARDGHHVTLRTLLLDQAAPEQEQLLHSSCVDSVTGQKAPPLVIAARNGHDQAVRMLVTRFKPPLTQTGSVRFGPHVIDGASALWCAAGAGHLRIVEELVKAGADVNQTTRINSTPLRAACFEGRLDIVRFLCESGADIHIANTYNNTCLMIASYKGHVEVVKYLLLKGANPNVAANCGATALHFASECGHVDIVRALFDKGGVMSLNEHGMTPLMAAAERCQEEVVEYITNRPDVSREERITAFELLGASFANDKEHYDIAKTFTYLVRSMRERWSQADCVFSKTLVSPIAAYDMWVERQTVDELLEIESDPHALHMESLCIRERVLGVSNPEVPHPVIFRGAVFADNARFDRCIALWLHALRLKQNARVCNTKDLLRFAQVFSQMDHIGVEITFSHMEEVLRACVGEVRSKLEKVANPGPKDDVDCLREELESNMHTFLYLLVVFSKMKKSLCSEDEFLAMRQVYEMLTLDPRRRDGASLLHLAVNPETPVDDFHTNDIVHFPNAVATKLLLDAGANTMAMDHKRNTPLHYIVSYQRIVSDFLTLHSIITSLIEAGAHADVVNAEGRTPLQAATTGVAEIILKSQSKLNLKCLAAKSVLSYKLSYVGHVPVDLVSFIELHGP